MRFRRAHLVTACTVLAATSVIGSASGAAVHESARQLTLVKYAGPSAPNGIVNPIVYGVAHGIFKKYGIDLQLSFPAGTSTATTVGLVANNTFQMASGTPTTMMVDYQNGIKTECISAGLEANPTGITLRKSANITSPKQLRGLTLGVSTGSPNIKVLQVFLQKFGISEGSGPSDVKVVQLSLAALPTAFIAHQIDGIVAFPADFDPQIAAEGVPVNSLLFTDYAIAKEIYTCYMVGDVWAAAHPKALKEIDEGLLEATHAVNQHPSEGGQALSAAAPGVSPPAGVTTQQWRLYEHFLTTKNTRGHAIGWISPKDMQATLAFGEQYLGMNPINPNVIYTNTPINQACAALKNLCPIGH